MTRVLPTIIRKPLFLPGLERHYAMYMKVGPKIRSDT